MNNGGYASGVIRWTMEALEPIHHGGGSDGNVTVLRRKECVSPDGMPYAVPFISGNSMAHIIRDGAAMFCMNALGVEDGRWDKRAINLLFSGGALSKGGSAVNLAAARELARLVPGLALMGYSAGNFMQSSGLAVDHVNLVCAENLWCMPRTLRADPRAQLAADYYVATEFTTRHEPTRDPRVMRLLTTSEQKRIVGEVSDKADVSTEDRVSDKARDSMQMIAKFEVVKPGSLWWSEWRYRSLAPLEMASLISALSYLCQEELDGGYVFGIAAKNNRGLGKVRIRFTDVLRRIDGPELRPDETALVATAPTDPLRLYLEHLRANREAILRAFGEAIP